MASCSPPSLVSVQRSVGSDCAAPPPHSQYWLWATAAAYLVARTRWRMEREERRRAEEEEEAAERGQQEEWQRCACGSTAGRGPASQQVA